MQENRIFALQKMKNFDQLIIFDSILSIKQQSNQQATLNDMQIKNILLNRIKQLDPNLNLQTFLLQQQSLFQRIQNAVDLQSDSQIIMLIIKLFKQINLQKIQSSFDMDQLFARVVLNDQYSHQQEIQQPNMSQLRQINASMNVNNNIDYISGELQLVKQSLFLLRQFYVEQCQEPLSQLHALQNYVSILNQKTQNLFSAHSNDIQTQQLQQQIIQLQNDNISVINKLNKQIQDLKMELSVRDDEIELLKQQLSDRNQNLNQQNQDFLLTNTQAKSPHFSGLNEQNTQSFNPRSLNKSDESITSIIHEHLKEKQALQQQITSMNDQYQKLQYEHDVAALKISQFQAKTNDLMKQIQDLQKQNEKSQKYINFCLLCFQRRYGEELKTEGDDSLLSAVDDTLQDNQNNNLSEKQWSQLGALYDECEIIRKQLTECQTQKQEILEQNQILQLQNTNLLKENTTLQHHLDQQSLSNIDRIKFKQLETEFEVLEHYSKSQTKIADQLRAEQAAALDRIEKLDSLKNIQEQAIQQLQSNFNQSLQLLTGYQQQFGQYNRKISQYSSEIQLVFQNQLNKLLQEQQHLQQIVQNLITRVLQNNSDNNISPQFNQTSQFSQYKDVDQNVLSQIFLQLQELKGQQNAQLSHIQQNRQILMNQNTLLTQLNNGRSSQSDKEQKLMIKNLDSALQQAKNNKEQILQQLLNIVKIIKDNDEVFQQLRLEFTFLDDVYKAIKYTGRIAQ